MRDIPNHHTDAFIFDIQRVGSWAVEHLPHPEWPQPHPRLPRDTVGDTMRHLVAQACDGDFPSIHALRKTVEWTLSELYWRNRWDHGLCESDREVRAAAQRLWSAMNAANL